MMRSGYQEHRRGSDGLSHHFLFEGFPYINVDFTEHQFRVKISLKDCMLTFTEHKWRQILILLNSNLELK